MAVLSEVSILLYSASVGGRLFPEACLAGPEQGNPEARDPKDADPEPIIAIDSLPGLVQGSVLEIHPWGSRLDDLEKSDIIIMDLDPGEDVSWQEVIDAALRSVGLESFAKTSDGKGLHVVAPLKPVAGFLGGGGTAGWREKVEAGKCNAHFFKAAQLAGSGSQSRSA